MSRASRLKPTETSTKRLSLKQMISRLILLIGIAGLLLIAGFLVLQNANRQGDPTAVSFDLAANPSLNPAESVMLGAYLTSNQAALDTPISTDITAIIFEVSPGENASQIADNLLAQSLIVDTTLFKNYLRYYGLDRQLEAGSYQLSRSMTVPQIAITLTDASVPEITIRITEGWRREQIADWIDGEADIPFTGAEFLAATGAGVPLPPDISFASEVPPGVTLEGFLFPDTYKVAINSSAAELVEKSLRQFDSLITAQMRADAANQGLNLYQVLILASIVEREAVVAEERPTIASVYLNRLAIDMLLQADPTVQYAMGYQSATDQWWNLYLTQADYTSVNSPYNTYLFQGLPPGPIANPGLDSIIAVIYPADTPYIFFRAACDGSGQHVFAISYEEHLGNACP